MHILIFALPSNHLYSILKFTSIMYSILLLHQFASNAHNSQFKHRQNSINFKNCFLTVLFPPQTFYCIFTHANNWSGQTHKHKSYSPMSKGSNASKINQFRPLYRKLHLINYTVVRLRISQFIVLYFRLGHSTEFSVILTINLNNIICTKVLALRLRVLTPQKSTHSDPYNKSYT